MAENVSSEQMDIDPPANGVIAAEHAQSVSGIPATVPELPLGQQVKVEAIHEHLDGSSGPADHQDGITNAHLTNAHQSDGPLIEPQQPAEVNALASTHVHAGGLGALDSSSNQEASLPDFTQQHITSIPEIQARYDAYVSGFSDPAVTDKEQLQCAETLMKGLLEYYYPRNQDFDIHRADFSVMAKHGWRFCLWPDEDKRKTPAKKGAAKKKTKSANRAFDPKTFAVYSPMVDYHTISPENIAGFVVMNKLEYENDDGPTYYEYKPQTYIGIMMDNLESFDQWVPDHVQKGSTKQTGPKVVSIPRADLLSHSLGIQGGIASGYGILLLGPRLEFYNYKQEPWTPKFPAQSVEEYPETVAYEEPEPFSHVDARKWMVDMRTASLADVDALFRTVNERDVVGRDGHVRPGPRTDRD